MTTSIRPSTISMISVSAIVVVFPTKCSKFDHEMIDIDALGDNQAHIKRRL